MRINKIIKNSKVNGPGTRYTIWVQGCSIQCKGCLNKDTWSFEEGFSRTTSELLADINKQEIDGITLTGGEPLDQFEEVIDFLKSTKHDIFLTTGYTLEKIKKEKSEILNYIDILVTGPFVESLTDNTSNWRGSTNQKISFLTKRSKKFLHYIPNYKTEIKINKKTGETIITGFTIPQNIKEFYS